VLTAEGRASVAALYQTLKERPSVRVLVVGDIMLDRYVFGDVERVSPEAPVPVVRVFDEDVKLGGAANVAANIQTLGARAGLVGCIGRDTDGDALLAACEIPGIDASAVIRTGQRPTTVKTRVLARNHHIVRLDSESDEYLCGADEAAVINFVTNVCPSYDILVLQDYNKGVLSESIIAEALRSAKEAQVPVIVDPKRRNFGAYGGASIFKPNRKEFEAFAGETWQEKHASQLSEYRDALGCETLLVTLGSEGMLALDGNGQLLRVPAMAQEVYDVSGAGDTVTAALALAVGAGFDLLTAMRFASVAAAVSVGHVGAQAVRLSEIGAALGVGD
jgi:D-beta-D-heptose 7-phosphate kinase/D-beta-D-heptose 1-phosphate adenosyltransferase